MRGLLAWQWGAPLWLLLVPLVVGAVWLAARHRGPAIAFSPLALWREDADDRVPAAARQRMRVLPHVLLGAGLVLLVLALARPMAAEARAAPREGIDILLCLDVSSSMAATDMGADRTRLDVARAAALAFVARRPEDRIGLLAFARFPDLRCPPTLDHEALARLLEATTPVASDGPEDATGLGAAVASAADVLAKAPSPSRVVLLLTDGEETVAVSGARAEIAPVHAGQLAARLGVRVHPIVAGRGRRLPGGRVVALDVRPLRDMARRTGGTFHRAQDAATLDAVYAQIDALETSPAPAPRVVLADRRAPLVWAGVLALLLGLLGIAWLEPSR